MNKKSISIYNCLFYVSYFFFSLYAFFGTIEIFESPLKLLTYISMGLIFLSFILSIQKYKYTEIIRLVILLLLSFVFVIKTGNFLCLKLFLILILCKNISFEKRISFDLKLRIIFLIIMLFLCIIGVAPDVTFLYQGKIRHSLGFPNPNILGMHILIMCFEVLYLNKNNLSFKKILWCFILLFITYLFDGCRTTLYLFVFSGLLILLYKKRINIFNNKVVKTLIIYSPFLVSMLILILYKLYANGNFFATNLDTLLSGRLKVIDFYANNFPVNLIGNDLTIVTKTFDTAIAYVLYAFGALGAIIYLIGFTKLFKYLYKVNNYLLIIIIFSFVIYGISEKLWLFPDCNIMITALSYIVFESKKESYNL